jgi:GTP-dependent dephospho-CoA kinase
MLILPEERRHFFKEPFGELFSDVAGAIPRLTRRTVYSVGDVVTHNLHKNGIVPAVSIIDGHTMRSPCTKNAPCTGRILNVKNPAGTITDDLIAGIGDAIAHPPATICVSGEEDLAVIPLVIAAPEGVIVLYGQPQKGVVVRTVDRQAKEKARELLSHFVRTGGS